MSGLIDSLESEAAKDKVIIAGSLNEIATWIGIEPDKLIKTVDEYNVYCSKGHDDLFAKDPKYLNPLNVPPYYGISCHSCFSDTIGGIKINHYMKVLDKDNKAIPGLFAAGVCTGGWESESYCYTLSGSTLGFAINSGRIAGENAARYVFV